MKSLHHRLSVLLGTMTAGSVAMLPFAQAQTTTTQNTYQQTEPVRSGTTTTTRTYTTTQPYQPGQTRSYTTSPTTQPGTTTTRTYTQTPTRTPTTTTTTTRTYTSTPGSTSTASPGTSTTTRTYTTTPSSSNSVTQTYTTSRSAPAPQANSSIPDPNAINQLLWSTLSGIESAYERKDYSALWQTLSPRLKSETSPSGLKIQFALLHDSGISLKSGLGRTPRFELAPYLIEDGRLRLRGSFDTQPRDILFDLLYVNDRGHWKLDAIAFANGN